MRAMAESHDELDENDPSLAVPRGRMMLLAVAFEGGLLVLAVVLGYFAGIPFWEDTGGAVGLAYGALLSLPLTLGVLIIAETQGRLFRQVREDLGKILALLRNCRPIDLLIIALLAGVCEEALFRGFLQAYLSGLTGPIAAIAISSILFGALHAVSISYFLFATLISVYLGVVYIQFDGLAAPIALHATYDFLALMYGIYWRPQKA
jgi:uncharacterized protein